MWRPYDRMLMEIRTLTHGGDADSLSDELDYEDMIALSGLYRQWAIYEDRFTPEQRTDLIAWSADMEELAKWVGKGWQAADPSPEMTFLKFIAKKVREHHSVLDLQHAKRALGFK
jgi:hypothetical protein